MASLWSQSFCDAVKDVFERLMHSNVTEINNVNPDESDCVERVTAAIGISGDVVGAVVLNLPRETAEELAIALMRDPYKLHEDAELADALGELVNMIAISAKAEFKGMKVSISTPAITIGYGTRVMIPRTVPKIEMTCKSEFGSFVMDVAHKQPKKSRPFGSLMERRRVATAA